MVILFALYCRLKGVHGAASLPVKCQLRLWCNIDISPSLTRCAVSDMSIHDVSVSAAETQAIIDEALGLRKKRQALTVREKEPDLKLVQPIPFLTYVVRAPGC